VAFFLKEMGDGVGRVLEKAVSWLVVQELYKRKHGSEDWVRDEFILGSNARSFVEHIFQV
jgi:hypothetical protein